MDWISSSFDNLVDGSVSEIFRVERVGVSNSVRNIWCMFNSLVFMFVNDFVRDRLTAFLATASLLTVTFFTKHARVGQLDMPVLFWMTLTTFWFWRGLKGKRINFVLSGISFGLGLMSKIIVAFLVPMSISIFVVWEFFRESRADATKAFWGLALCVGVGLLVALPWHIAVTRKLGTVYWDQAYGYHVFSRMARPVEGFTSSFGILFWPIETLNKLAGLFPFVLLGMSKESKPETMTADRHRFLWSLLLVPFVVFSVTATKYHTYILMFIVPLIIFGAMGIHYVFSGRASTRIIGMMAPLSFACLVWSQTHPVQRSLGKIAEDFGMLTMPPLYDIVFVGGFIALTCMLAVLGRWYARRLGGDRRSLIFKRLYIWGFIVPAIVFSLGPLTLKKSEWIDLRTFMRNQGTHSLMFFGDRDATNDVNLSILAYGLGIKTKNEEVENWDKAEMQNQIWRLDKAGVIVFQKASKKSLPIPAQAIPCFENENFVVYGQDSIKRPN